MSSQDGKFSVKFVIIFSSFIFLFRCCNLFGTVFCCKLWIISERGATARKIWTLSKLIWNKTIKKDWRLLLTAGKMSAIIILVKIIIKINPTPNDEKLNASLKANKKHWYQHRVYKRKINENKKVFPPETNLTIMARANRNMIRLKFKVCNNLKVRDS